MFWIINKNINPKNSYNKAQIKRLKDISQLAIQLQNLKTNHF